MKILSILFILFFLSVQSVSAHVLKSSGSVGAVMHIQPEDDPIAGEESSFYFEFKDKNGKFQASDCACMFSVLSNGAEVYTQPLFQNNTEPSLTNASVFYTFPERGVYTINVTGAPKSGQKFEAFTLEYDIRVERTSGNQNSQESGNWFTDHIPHLVGGVLGFSALAFILYKGRRKEGKE